MSVICSLLQIYIFVVILRIVLGMIVEFGRVPWGHPVRRITEAVGKTVDPLLAPLRRMLPGLPVGGIRLDLSPLVLIIGLQILLSILPC